MLKIFLKMFFMAGLMFGVLTGIFDFFKFSTILPSQLAVMLGIKTAVLGGVLYGAGMSLILVPFHYCCFRNVLDKSILMPADFSVRQETAFSLQRNSVEVFEFINTFLEKKKGIRITEMNPHCYHIVAIRSGGWKSTKDLITISLDTKIDDMTFVSINSRPESDLLLVDYGKNYETVLEIKKLLLEKFS